MAKKENNGGRHYGPVLSPMSEDFHPSDSHDCTENCETNGIPGYPKGSERTAEEVTIFEGGKFGEFKRDYGKE